MTVARYAARTAAFAAVYLLVYWVVDFYLVLPAAVAAVWLLAQGFWGLRRFDVITLVTVTTASAIAGGGTMAGGFGRAFVITVPAMMFALLIERWLPGWWQGHGDRFRSRRTRLTRLAGAAGASAVTFLVLATLLLGTPALVVPVVYITLVLAAALAGRAVTRSRTPRAAGLTLVR